MKCRIKLSFVCQMLNPTDVNHVVLSLVHKKSSFSMKTMQNIGGQVIAGNKSTSNKTNNRIMIESKLEYILMAEIIHGPMVKIVPSRFQL